MKNIYSKKYIVIICGDVNVKFLIDNKKRSQLVAALHSYNLAGIVKFCTRCGLNSHTAIDNVSIDTSITGKYDLYPLINGPSDHDAQLLILNKGQEKESYIYIERKLNKYTIEDFQLKLCHETWEPDFDGNNIGKIFNTFLNIFLRTHYSNFPLIQAKYKMNQNSWITLRIVTSSKNKRELYKELQNNNNNNNNNNPT